MMQVEVIIRNNIEGVMCKKEIYVLIFYGYNSGIKMQPRFHKLWKRNIKT